VSRFDARRFQGTIVAKMSGFGAFINMKNRHGLMTVFLIFDFDQDALLAIQSPSQWMGMV
jgi:hypothetical protein